MLTDCFGKNRGFVMGMSIIFIVLLHTHFHLPFVLHFIRRMGYIYVDLFMMLSGYGLYYSLTKTCSLKRYFIKRGIRILPTYYSLALVYIIFKLMTDRVLFTDILGVLTTMSFWSGQKMVFSWFAQSLVAFYVLAPLMYKTVKSVKSCWWLVLVSVIIILPFVTTPRLFMAISRIPVFLVGMCFAKSIKERGEVWLKSHIYTIFAVGLIGFLILAFLKFYFQGYISHLFGKTYYLIFLPPMLMVPSLAVLFSMICNKLLEIRTKFVVSIINRLGSATFEIYLFQSMLYLILFYFIPRDSFSNIEWMLIMLVAIWGGVFIFKSC